MTGQGNKQFEAIRASQTRTCYIDLDLTYSTISGQRVRNLSRTYTNKALHEGKTVESAVGTYLISGQVFMRGKDNHFHWAPTLWEPTGKHVIDPTLSLVQVKSTTQQADLFQNI